MVVLRKDTGFEFPSEALGGTRDVPRLKPADELLLNWLEEMEDDAALAIYHDHHAILATVLHQRKGVSFVSDSILHHHRREASFETNGLIWNGSPAPLPLLAPAAAPGLALMHLPKYLDLFDWYLHDVATNRKSPMKMAVAFQTRHFTSKMLDIAGRYANEVTQSRAYKKARLLLLSDWREPEALDGLPLRQMDYNAKTYVQYPGVFSGEHIDYATQFLLDTWRTNAYLKSIPPPGAILDIGLGNGVIVDQLQQAFYPAAKLYGTEVSNVALQSAKLNGPPNADFRWQNDLTGFEDTAFDLIVTNPPFHEGHRNTIEPTLKLFREAAGRLAPGARFVLVANRHLNYATQLERLFSEVREVATNDKFVVYSSSSTT